MRSDHILYAVAIMLFILTGTVLAYQVEFKELWVVATVVLGLLFIGLGYFQRPKAETKTTTIEAPSPTPSPVQEVVEERVPAEVALT
ncbi:MAG: hypothetical protein QXH37_05935, partial [Candidatus Bathyarchaeia archaeon]